MTPSDDPQLRIPRKRPIRKESKQTKQTIHNKLQKYPSTRPGAAATVGALPRASVHSNGRPSSFVAVADGRKARTIPGPCRGMVWRGRGRGDGPLEGTKERTSGRREQAGACGKRATQGPDCSAKIHHPSSSSSWARRSSSRWSSGSTNS